ncbi:RIB43A-like with coiled-coils protein 1 [Caerostris darwini]|uniref:RIB43A-like with coiled-coils protein 1 n=1 Tax=Caerostris darwini TaxID=1538125 RepID=A0AAV4SRV0_9ARAC|nr:RIB43A-like with coiled-coils protein 1 [Caerostris darwini]
MNRRRLAEEARKRRIFNAKQRQIGVDVDALNYQVQEHRLARSRETQRERHFADEAKRLSDLAELMEKQKQEEIVEKNRKVDEYRTQEQRPEYRKEFDLYDPNRLKKERPPRISADEPCPISGVQKLAGEDLENRDRMQKQKNQVREVLLQQMQEKRMQNFKQDKEKQDFEDMLLMQDSHALQLAKEHEERRRKAVADLKEDNKTIAEETRDMNLRDKISDDISKKKDIEYNIRSDLLSEDPNVARSSFGPNRVVPDRWKGMSEKQLEEYRKGQVQQMIERRRKEDQEQRVKAEWDAQLIHQENIALLMEQENKERRFDFNKKVSSLNTELSYEQRRQQEFLEKVVYTNVPTKEFFDQFNTTSR